MNKLSFVFIFLLATFSLVGVFFALCNPGDHYCVNRFTMNLCRSDGSGYDPITCVNEECDFNLGACPSFLGAGNCNPATDSFKCIGSQSWICDGSNWRLDTDCGAKGCDQSNGICYDCNKNDPASTYCQDKFTLVSCPDGYFSSQDCRSLGANYICDSTKKQCVVEQQSTVNCINNGELRCNGNNLEICQNQKWEFVEACTFGCDPTNYVCYDCNKNDPASTYCQDKFTLVSCPDGYFSSQDCRSLGANYICDSTKKQCVEQTTGPVQCNNGERRCNNQILEQCNNNQWSEIQNCLQAPFVGCYQQSPTNAYCKECAVPNQKECITQTSYRECLASYLFSQEVFCPSNYICTANGQCVAFSSGGGVGGGREGSGGGSFSGGGEISGCKSYSEWVLNSTLEYQQGNQTCQNLTYLSFCVRQDGTLDLSKWKKNSTINCFSSAKKQVICNYIYSKSVEYVDNSTGQCRNCTKDVFVYTCDGVADPTNVKEALSCSDFYPCSTSKEQLQAKEPQDFLSTYGPALVLILILALIVVGFYLWKSSEQKEEQKEN